jgi:hypothetical protein
MQKFPGGKCSMKIYEDMKLLKTWRHEVFEKNEDLLKVKAIEMNHVEITRSHYFIRS